MMTTPVRVSRFTPAIRLTATLFGTQVEIPPPLEWLPNLSRANMWRAYRPDIAYVHAFAGLGQPEEVRDITRAHVIAWREDMTLRCSPTIPSGAGRPRCRPSMRISAKSLRCRIRCSLAPTGGAR